MGVWGISVFVAVVSYFLFSQRPRSWSFIRPSTPDIARRQPQRLTPRDPSAKSAQQVEPQEKPEPPPLRSTNQSPKAGRPDSTRGTAVPTISLDLPEDHDVPRKPVSAERADKKSKDSLPEQGGISKPSASQPVSDDISKLMPPPPRPSSTRPRRGLVSPQKPLQTSSSGPLPYRGPPSSNSLLPSPSLGVKAPNPRRKVKLAPGYSPLDWAALLKSGANLSGVSTLQRVTPSQLKAYDGRRGRPAWSACQGRVYNITPYLPYHPGGEGELRKTAGKNGEILFMEAHPWVNWENMLGECLVGIMVGENEAGLDGMD